MKAICVLLTLVTALLATIKPDMAAFFDGDKNYQAQSSVSTSYGDTIRIRDYVYRPDGLPDTVFLMMIYPTLASNDTFYNYDVYHYDFVNSKYFIDTYVKQISKHSIDFEHVLTTKTNYDESGLPVADSVFTAAGDTLKSIRYYTKDSDNKIIKTITKESVDQFDNSDSTCWYYNQVGDLESIVQYEVNSDFNMLQTIYLPSYRNGTITSVCTQSFASNGKLVGDIRTHYEMPDSRTPIQKDVAAFAGAVSHMYVDHNGRVANVKEKYSCDLFMANGRRVRTVSLGTNGEIDHWNAIPAGYYILQLKNSKHVRTLTFRK